MKIVFSNCWLYTTDMAEPVIYTRELTRKFGAFTAVDRISFEVEKGEIFGFLGANGAGKTTAIRMLCGLLKPTSGEAVVAGWDIRRHPNRVKQRIGYMSQRFSLYEDLTVKENIYLYGGIYGLKPRQLKKAAARLVDEVGLAGLENRLVSDIPLGWRQKLAFSAALIHEPDIVFLDEPTSGVDPITRKQFWEMIYRIAAQGTTMFITTHYMDEAEYCNRVSIMSAGRIQALDTPLALKKQFKVPDMEGVFIQLAR